MIRDGNTISVGKRLSFDEGMRIQDAIVDAIKNRGYQDIVLSLLETKSIYPDGILPLVTLSDALRKKEIGIQVLPHEFNMELQHLAASDCPWESVSAIFRVGATVVCPLMLRLRVGA
jgi:hypothetical protein